MDTDKSNYSKSNILSIIKYLKTIKKYNNNIDILINDIIQIYEPSKGHIYCLYNEVYKSYGDNVYKLGKASCPEIRKSQYTTSYLKPCEYKLVSKEFLDNTIAEQVLFKTLSEYRIQTDREFFNCDLNKINDAFKKVEDFFVINDSKDKLVKNFFESYDYNNKVFNSNRIRCKNKKNLTNNDIEKKNTFIDSLIENIGFKKNDLSIQISRNEFDKNLKNNKLIYENDFWKYFGKTPKLESIKSYMGYLNSILKHYNYRIKVLQKDRCANKKRFKVCFYELNTID